MVTLAQVDAADDLALLQAGGRFAHLPIAASRTVKRGGMAATVSFPGSGFYEEARKPGERIHSWLYGFLINLLAAAAIQPRR